MTLLEVTPVIEGGDVTLQCIPVMTYPPPSITWLVNGLDTQVSTQNFSISSVNDSVIYQCLIEAVFTPTTNKAGPPLSTSLITTTLVECKYFIMSDCGNGVHYTVICSPTFP